MHIVFVTNEFVTESGSFDGGLANYLYNICIALKAKGHHLSVVVSSEKNEFIQYNGIDVYRVKRPTENFWLRFFDKILFQKFRPLLYNIFLSYTLNKQVKTLNNKLPIHVAQYPNIRGLALFKPKRLPYVIRCSSFRKLINMASDMKKVTFYEKQVEWLETFVLKRCNSIYAPSKLIAEVIRLELHKPATVIETLFQEKDESELSYDVLNELKTKTSNKRYLLYYGRLGNWKGTVELANVLYNFLESNPDMYFVLIGKDKGYKGKPMMDYIKEKAGKHTSRVIYYANLRHEQLFPVIDHAHAVVLPSRIENLSNACIESMARGKVVLGTNGASYEQLITDGVNGFLFEKMNEADLLNKMNLIAKLDDKRREELGNAAKETVKRLHPDVICNQLLNYYTEVIQSFHNSSQKHKHHYGLPATLSSKNN